MKNTKLEAGEIFSLIFAGVIVLYMLSFFFLVTI